MTEHAARLVGKIPVPKGSMIIRTNKSRLELARMGVKVWLADDDGHQLKPWRAGVVHLGETIRQRAGDTFQDGPLSVQITFTLQRPPSVTLKARAWPWKKPDVDKLLRSTFDALTDSLVWHDDAQICEVVMRKAYPDTPGCPDVLPAPGVVVRIWRTGEEDAA